MKVTRNPNLRQRTLMTAGFAAAVQRLNSDDDLWGRLSVNGQRHVEAQFGLAAAETALLKILDRVGIQSLSAPVAVTST